MASYSAQQLDTIGVTERVASVLSLLGCVFVITTFAFSARFRKPVNRLILYAVFGNVIYTISTLIATNGMAQGPESTLCQTQAFLIQAFLPADALWNLSMALNVFVTVFKHYDTAQLRAREPYYHAVNYGVPFVIALAYCFIASDANGKVYGNAVIWCWIPEKWDYLRIATCYGPAWLCIIASFTIYVLAGLEIRKKRRQLRVAGDEQPSQTPSKRFTPMKTTEVRVETELATLESPCMDSFPESQKTGIDRITRTMPAHEYSVSVRGAHGRFTRAKDVETALSRARQRNSALEANKAAWRYTKSCLLFFASLLVTWLPSSVNRVYALIYPNVTPPYGLSYVASLVLPLTGFWNSIIYITTSWSACKALYSEDIAPILFKKERHATRVSAGWEIPARPRSYRPEPRSPPSPYSDAGKSEEYNNERGGRYSPSDSLANLATEPRAL